MNATIADQRQAWTARICRAGFLALMIAGSAWDSFAMRVCAQQPQLVGPSRIRVTSKASLLHLGSLDSFDITTGGVDAAKTIIESLNSKKPSLLARAISIYDRIIPNENFGGEYTALRWLCECISASTERQKEMLANKVSASYYEMFVANDFAVLREYLNRKYHLAEIGDEHTAPGHRRERFLEDFVLFNNPHRPKWEKSDKLLAALDLKPGQRIVDVGCGPGFFSFQFAEQVGTTGHVFSVDTNGQHVDYVNQLARNLGVANITAVQGTPADIGVKEKVDLAFMCSLYHIVYAAVSREDRASLLESIRRALTPTGRLVVVDNALVEDATLPYHGPYIAKELIIAQLAQFGFRLVETHQFIPQRYMLIFEQASLNASEDSTTDSAVAANEIAVGKESLVHLQDVLAPEVTTGGREAAALFLKALEKKDPQSLKAARDRYSELIPREKIGEEYTAFQWLCECLASSDEDRQKLLVDTSDEEYYRRLSEDDFVNLKKYLQTRYRPDLLGSNVPPDKAEGESELDQTQLTFWRDYLLFNNPRREQWEKTSQMLSFLQLKPGDSIADVGCGPGFFTFKFSSLVGSAGHVFAVDTNEDHLKYVDALAQRRGIRHIDVVKSKLNDVCLPEKCADVVFLCSLYHMVYATSMEFVKDQFLASIKKSLKEGGRLVIVDNAVVGPHEVPYHGPFIAKELVIAQLKLYGFRLTDSTQLIPQRYLLVFQAD